MILDHHGTFHKTKLLPMKAAYENDYINQQYCLNFKGEKWIIFFWKPYATKYSPQSYVYYMEFYHNFLMENSLIGIVNSKYTERNKWWCRILEIEDPYKNVRKTQDRKSNNIGEMLNMACIFIFEYSTIAVASCID